MDFILVVDSDELKSDYARILRLQRKLVERLKKESPEPWQRPYIRNAWVMVPEDFQKRFGYRITESSAD
jgi:hypothetical protein